METENPIVAAFDNFLIEPIHEKYAWRLCDFCTVNADRLKRFFPKTLAQNLTPTLAQIFAEDKVREFSNKEEFLYVLKEKENRTLIGLVYIKEVDFDKQKAELAYCIGYQYEGKGWMTLAVNALSLHAIEKLGLTTLQIISHKSNHASIKVAEKCGYLWIKTLLKEHTPPNEEALDMELYELSA